MSLWTKWMRTTLLSSLVMYSMLSRLITLSPTRSNLLMVHLLPPKSRAGTPRRIPRPACLSSFFGAAAAGQRLDPLDFFARLLIYGGVAEVDVPAHAGVRVILLLSRWVRGCARLFGVHSVFSISVGQSPGA